MMCPIEDVFSYCVLGMPVLGCLRVSQKHNCSTECLISFLNGSYFLSNCQNLVSRSPQLGTLDLQRFRWCSLFAWMNLTDVYVYTHFNTCEMHVNYDYIWCLLYLYSWTKSSTWERANICGADMLGTGVEGGVELPQWILCYGRVPCLEHLPAARGGALGPEIQRGGAWAATQAAAKWRICIYIR